MSVMIKIMHAKPQHSLWVTACAPRSDVVILLISYRQDSGIRTVIPASLLYIRVIYFSIYGPEFTHPCNKRAALFAEKNMGFGARLAPEASRGSGLGL